MLATDVSEAADSENIIPAINKVFPHAEIIHYAGLIYHLGLNDILSNIPEEPELLYSLLKADDLTTQKNYTIMLFVCALSTNACNSLTSIFPSIIFFSKV